MAPMRKYRFSNRQTFLEEEYVKQAEFIEELESMINSLEEHLVKKMEISHELEDSLVVFSKDIKEFYEENTLLAGEIHKNS